MEFKNITAWSVSKGMATPVNPFDYDSTVEYTAYERFAQFAQQHTYATNAPDGSYSADRFGKIVWQYKDWITEKQDFNEWIDVTDNFADSITVKNNWPSEKRRFLPFIQAL